ncbi:protein FAR1-RELATED SEQUENCE 5-like [Argentina anserina]|uniref:protein FAR1-RELATED SEQUENCE 5-like n=1 Tax=Argentina anserina TaxID=57926 RepID=UPI0021768CEB|nr:protein FAR1-RELATED SEQUENCE 5-like [Potentilla anserina]
MRSLKEDGPSVSNIDSIGLLMDDISIDDEDLKVGMQVHSDDEAYNLYNTYALRKGFSIRKSHVRRDASNKIRQREFVCSKEGFALNRDVVELEPNKHRKLETRVGCKAMISFVVKDGICTVSHINSDYNHELARPEERQFLRSGRSVTDACGHVFTSMKNAGIGPTKSFFYIANEVGGLENVGCTKKDVYNYLQRKKNEMLEAGDAQSLLNHFKSRQGEDPNFFYSMQLDQYSRMTNFFWRDSRAKLDYDCFGDVICFDTTFRTNKYNLICAPIVGVNHHWRNVLFGCAFLLDETTESFVWLFESFLESMGNKAPITIFTDEDKAMANAVPKVFPNASHRLCTWHTAKNASKKIGSYLGNPEFKKQFNHCLHNYSSEIEFQVSWDSLISKFNVGHNTWLTKLYSLREKWCAAFNLDTFSAKIRSTQRSESTNNVFQGISTHTMELIEFVHHYEKKIEEMRLTELEDDFRCKNGAPRPKVWSRMLKSAAKVYTNKMFQLFETEFIGCMGVRLKEVSNKDQVYIYEAIEDGRQSVHKIEYNSTSLSISCSCKSFSFLGIMCRHALKVFDTNNITTLPSQYILKRWTKEAKKGIVVSNGTCGGTSENSKTARVLRLSELMHEGNNVYDIASLTNSGTKIIKDMLIDAMKCLEKDKDTLQELENLRKSAAKSDSSIPNIEPQILNPPSAKTKGMKNCRIKDVRETNQRKKRTKENQENNDPKAPSHVSTLNQQFVVPNPPFYNQGMSNFVLRESLSVPNKSFSLLSGANTTTTTTNAAFQVDQDGFLGKAMMQHYHARDNILMFGGTTTEASCSSDGSYGNTSYGEVQLCLQNYHYNNGAEANNQKIMVSENGLGLDHDQAPLNYGLEEIKQLISSSTTSGGCNNFLFDENKTEEKVIMYY